MAQDITVKIGQHLSTAWRRLSNVKMPSWYAVLKEIIFVISPVVE